jgi:hypothetical protein
VKTENRLVVTFLLRLAFLFFAGWVALRPEALPGADLVVRIGLAALFLVTAIFIGEVVAVRAHLGMLLHALRTATQTGGSPGAVRKDDRAAVDILIRALDAKEAGTREKAHRNLVRLTGQDLPSDRGAWDAWWKENREGYQGRPERAGEDDGTTGFPP